MKNAVDTLSNLYGASGNNEALLRAQKEVKEVFEKVTGIVEADGEVPGRDGTGPDGVPSLLERVQATGGDEAARASLLGEIPAQVPAVGTAIASVPAVPAQASANSHTAPAPAVASASPTLTASASDIGHVKH